MNLIKPYLLYVVLLISSFAVSQHTLSNQESLDKYYELHEIIKTKNIKLNDEIYWAYYFEIDDLVNQITNNHELVLLHYYTYAYNCRYLGLTKEAIHLYNKFFTYYTKNELLFTPQEKVKFTHYRAQSYGYLADVYAKASLLDSAGITHRKNIKFTKKLKNLNRASALNNYGLFFYWTKKELDSALLYFNQSLVLTKSIQPINHLLGSVRDNIADIYVEQGKIAEANELYRDNFEFYQVSKLKKSNDKDFQSLDAVRLAAAGAQLINTSIDLNQLEEVDNVLHQMHQILIDSKSTKNLEPSSRLQYLQAKERVLFVQNKIEDAYKLSKKTRHLSDSIVKVNFERQYLVKNMIDDVAFQRLKTKYAIEKELKENKIKNQELKLWIISISSISVLGFFLSLYFNRKQHIINAQNRQQIAELKNKKLKSEIESKQRDLSDFALNLTQNQEWAIALANKLSYLKTTKGRERKKLFDAFEKELQNRINFDMDTNTFYQKLDQLSDVFYKELNTKFPNLSKTEKRLCSLIRLKIESHKIAVLQNITLSSVNTSRYRLRKKLNLSKNEDLDNYIQSL
ncbi:transcriptional regulator [Maribacter ulvicola]|uniref:Tetratricopeptide repeat-containing protein n=1 Tax=Maribacter ulvicola TaxID=228959 RepID=A0A1N6UE30_9FLAO|nr:tetratricopeptide repeat protein [Maribacter ulvicola]SIQ63822.1 hypothetical protein SAMN05421797_102308 [Maribacter ulvicola]